MHKLRVCIWLELGLPGLNPRMVKLSCGGFNDRPRLFASDRPFWPFIIILVFHFLRTSCINVKGFLSTIKLSAKRAYGVKEVRIFHTVSRWRRVGTCTAITLLTKEKPLVPTGQWAWRVPHAVWMWLLHRLNYPDQNNLGYNPVEKHFIAISNEGWYPW